MRVTLMHNPKAGGQQASIKEVEAALRRAGYQPAYVSTKEDDYASALDDPGELVVIAGGDGTVEKISRRMVGRGIPIGILPLGTANNIATSLGIRGSIEELVSGWDLSQRTTFDVGFVRSPWGEGHFLEGVGLGLFPHAISAAYAPEVQIERDDPEAELTAAFRFIGTCVQEHSGSTYSICLDGVDLSGEYLLVEVVNTDWIGPSLHLGSGADPSDGLLDLVLAEPGKRDALRQYLEKREPGSTHLPPVSIRRGKRIEIRWAGAKLHVDDEIWPEENANPDQAPAAESSEHLAIEVKPGALEFLIPAR